MLEQIFEYGDTIWMLQIQGNTTLIRVEQQEVPAILPWRLCADTATALIAFARFLHLNHVSPHPGQHHRTRRTRFELCQVEYPYPFQCFFHTLLSCQRQPTPRRCRALHRQ